MHMERKEEIPGFILRDTSSPCYFCRFREENCTHDGEHCMLMDAVVRDGCPDIKDMACKTCRDMEFSSEWQSLIDGTDGRFEAFQIRPYKWAIIYT